MQENYEMKSQSIIEGVYFDVKKAFIDGKSLIVEVTIYYFRVRISITKVSLQVTKGHLTSILLAKINKKKQN